MKTIGILRTAVLVLVISSLVLPSTGCWGDYKGVSRNDDAVVGVLFGGYWAVGLVYGFFIQFARFPGANYSASITMDSGESRDLAPNLDESTIAYIQQRDLTLLLMHDDVNDVTIEMAVPGHSAGRYVLPAGKLDAPWVALEVGGTRYVASERAEVVVEIKQYADRVGGDVIGEFRGQLEAPDGSLIDVSASFSLPRGQ